GRGSGQSRSDEIEPRNDGETKHVANAEEHRRITRGTSDAAEIEGRREPDRGSFGEDVAYANGQQEGWSAITRRECDWWLAEPDVGRVVDGLAFRVERLRAIGNGQVPAVAALAWSILSGGE
ncbi:hypothetical protein M0R36_10860, partial [bacterium]|nr:hypothetical protein [bacterium]